MPNKKMKANGYLTEDIDDSESEALETMEAYSADVDNDNVMSNKLPVIPDNIINENRRSLKMKQREVFNFTVNRLNQKCTL